MEANNSFSQKPLSGLLGDLVDFIDVGETLISFSGTIKAISKLISEIKDEDQAFRQAISKVYTFTWLNALKHYKVDFVIDGISIQPYINSLEKVYANREYSIKTFRIDDFWNNPIISYTHSYFNNFLQYGKVTERNRINVENYLRDYLKINFFELLLDKETVYTQLTTFINSPQYQEYYKLHIKHKYRTKLKNLYNEVVFDDKNAMTLKELYIEPQFTIYKSFLSKSKKRRSEKDSDAFIDIEDTESIHSFIYEVLNSKELLENKENYLENNKNLPKTIFILGYPGQGKSSFCKRFLYDIVDEKLPISKEVYFIKLRDTTQTNDLLNNPIKILREMAERDMGQKINKQDFTKSLLVLDGLDELFMVNKITSRDIDNFCYKLISLTTREYQELYIILTSRHGYIDVEKIPTDDLLILQLKEFSLKQQKQWLSKYHRFHPETYLKEVQLEQFNNEKRFIHIKELISQPILLYLIASLDKPIEDNVNRSKIYDQLFSTLLDRRYDTHGKLDVHIHIDKEEIREMIREIAFAIYQSNREYIHKNTLLLLPSFKNAKFPLKDSLKNLMMSFYFREVEKEVGDESEEDTSNYAVEFLHKTLQEYMVAEYIWHTLVIEFTERHDKKKKYAIEDTKVALQKLSELFAYKRLSIEITEYLIEIISSSEEVKDKIIVAERLKYFFPFLFDYDFLYPLNIDQSSYNINTATNIFYGCWTILSSIALGENLIDETIKNRFCYFLKISNYPYLNLANCNIAGADLQGANLQDVNLQGANLQGVNLQGVLMHGALLQDANLQEANLQGSYMTEANLQRAHLQGADLRRVDMQKAVLEEANLQKADLQGANLQRARLKRADLRGADLRGANLKGADLRGVDLRGAHLQTANLRGAYMNGAILKGVNLQRTLFIETYLDEEHREYARAGGAYLE